MPFFVAEAAGHPTISEWVPWTILVSPLVAWALITVSPRKIPRIAGLVTIAGIAIACALSFATLLNVYGADGGIAMYSHEWFTAGDVTVNLGVRLDGLTAVMLVVVTSVSLLVQIYSTGYMAGDPGYGRYFAHMALVPTALVGRVLSGSRFMS